MARSSIYQVTSIGIESAFGTIPTKLKQLNSLQIAPSVKVDQKSYKPQGNKYNTISVLNKEWSVAKLSGPMTYSEVLYILKGMYSAGAATASTPSGAWTYPITPKSTSADAYSTFTIQKGDGTNYEIFTGSFFTGWGYKGDRSSIEISGDLLGQRMQTNQASVDTSPATPVTGANLVPVSQKPIFPAQVDFFLGAASTDVDTAAPSSALRVQLLSYEFNHTDAKSPLWVVDSSLPSFSDVVETEPKIEFKTMVEAKTANLTVMKNLRKGDFRYISVMAKGDLLVTGTPNVYYEFKHDMAVKVIDVAEFADKDGVYAFGYTFEPQFDSAWNTGQAHQISLVCDLDPASL